MKTTSDTRQIPDDILQTAVDEALLETFVISLATRKSSRYWEQEKPTRLALARALLDRLPEPTPPVANGKPEGMDWKARYEGEQERNKNALNDLFNAERKAEKAQAKLDYVHNMGLRFGMMSSSDKPEPYLAHTWTEDSDHERIFREWSEGVGWKARAEKTEVDLARIIAAAHEAGWNGIENSKFLDQCIKDLAETLERMTLERNHAINTEKLAHHNAKLPQLRPISEAGPVPEGCVRVYGWQREGHLKYIIGTAQSKLDTHFADIRLPSQAPTVEADPYAELKAAHAAGKVIEFKPYGCPWTAFEEGDSPDFTAPIYCYRVKPTPSTFQAHGKTWTSHTPGDEMPCDGKKQVEVMLQYQSADGDTIHPSKRGRYWLWDKQKYTPNSIIGWRYADEPQPAPEPTPWTPSVGDVVRLKSGGPKMTVRAFNPEGAAVLDWFKDDERDSCILPATTLQLA